MPKRYIAEVINPVTGEPTTLTADTATALEQLLAEHLEENFPDPAGDTAGPDSDPDN